MLILKNTADFFLKSYWNGEMYHCVFCGEAFRPGSDIGLIRYNHSELNYCPYCAAYAGQPALPQWVKNFADSRKPRKETYEPRSLFN